jgi:hypothetical protein
MGANVSNQMIDSTTSIVSKALTDISTTVKSSNSSYTEAKQEMSVFIKGLTMINSDITFDQTADITVSTMLENSTKLSNDLANKLKATLKETMVNDLTQANEGLNLGQLNISNSQQRTRSYIENNVENIISSTINNEVTQYINGVQTMPVTLLDVTMKGSSIIFNQEMQIKAIAKNVSTNIVKNVIKNVLTADVTKELTNKTEQLNKGLDLLLILVIIVVVIVGGIGYKTVQGQTKEMKMWKFRSGRGSKRRGNISVPGMQRRGGTGNFNVCGGDDDYSGGDYYGGVLSDTEATRKTKELAKEIASTKKWYAIGCVIALILIFAVWYYGKQWVAGKYDISYLGDLEPNGGRSGFYAPSMVYSIPQYKYKVT